MSMRFILFIALLLAVSCGSKGNGSGRATASGVSKTLPPLSDEDIRWTEQFIDLVNAHRSTLGLGALQVHDDLHAIARTHSSHMADQSVGFGHTGFSGRCASARTILGGGNWCAENVARGQKSPQAVFNAWLGSSGHRSNIESSRPTFMGFGFAPSANGLYWTQIFLER